LRADIRDAELVTIGVGFADVYFGALSPYFYMTPAEARQSIKKDSRILERKVQDFGETYDVLLDEVLKLASPSDTAIRVMDFYFPYVARYQELGIYQEIKEYWIAFSECIISSASGRNIPTARIFLLFNGATGDEDPIEKGWIAWDDLHPNEKGMELIVAEFRKLGYRYADQ
jgi:lysophospholipase L1-like esterase